ncbi:E3 ubiquitin-protein ligase DTX4a isoform X2 [Syngnathoides biaculeatus]|uniref:E3 ubiquitin-protein ligase DTX4a isoform X2 n=1 Tax=Syngnathoides biaculeatus TaxID=300417 RepID=UPI002ADE8B46|nr:E3 ubiquitin-protein ligase DTX4a isoform X2 [Syngnathoides biaculeatus]
MLLASAVVVWEWLNEHGRWRPYSPAVCHHIEAVIRSEPRCASVVLGQVDSRLSPYIIDLQSMHQFRQDTGTLRAVRRSFYEPTSAPGQGWLWEWENDVGSWTAYDTEVGIAIQAARDRQQPWLDLAPLGFCYLIDFGSMTQINGQTQRCRRIQRRADLAYPLVSGPLPKSHHTWAPASMPHPGGAVDVSAGIRTGCTGGGNGSAYPSGALPASAITSLGPPCSCQQCMLLLSVKAGTMSSAQTLGRRPPQTKPPSPKLNSHLISGAPFSLTLPRLPSISRSLSPHRTSTVGATSGPGVAGGGLGIGSPDTARGFTHSLSLLNSATASLSINSGRPPPPSLPPPPPPPLPTPPHPSTSLSCPVPAVPTSGPPIGSACAPSPSARVLGPLTSSLPPRSSLAGLSRPAMQRLAMVQSRALIASGVPTVPVKNLNGSSPVHPALAGITGILMSAAGLPVCLTRPPKLVLHPPPVSKSDIKPVPGLGHCCRKTTKKQARKGRTPEEVVKRYLQKVRSPPEEDCTICMEVLAGPSGYKGPGVGGISRAESVGRLAQCGHQYHLQCLVAMYNNGNKDGSLQCPTCKTIYGVKTGNQPPGKMEYHVIPHSLPGHPDCKTIRIIYNIPPGIQGLEHPNPGKPFTARGFPRHCYLPDSDRGRKVLRLLLVAWDRHLIFSVGTSSTTGESDTVIWNEVHHKTEFGSNLTGHGYPDPGHLDNVLEELKAQGITEDECLPRE